MVHPLWEMALKFLKMLNIELPCDSGTPLLGTHPKEVKTCQHKTLCMNVHDDSISYKNLKLETIQLSTTDNG